IQEALDSNPMLEVAEEGADSDSPDKILEGANGHDAEPMGADRAGEQESADDRTVDSPESAVDSEWNEDIPTDLAVDTSWEDVYQSAPSGTGLAKPDGEDMDFESRRGNSESLQDYLSWQLNLTPMTEMDRIIAEAIIDGIEPNGMLGQPIE